MKIIVKYPETSHIVLEIIVRKNIIPKALDPCSLTHARSLGSYKQPYK